MPSPNPDPGAPAPPVAFRARAAAPFRIPILGYVSAGLLEWAEGQHLGFTLLPVPDVEGDLFGLIVRGDSMVEAGILDGHIVLIRPQRTFQDGDIVVAAVEGQATLKRIYRDGAGFRLEPANASYPTLFLSAEEIRYALSDPRCPEPPDRRVDLEPPEVRLLGLMVGLLSRAVFPVEPPG